MKRTPLIAIAIISFTSISTAQATDAAEEFNPSNQSFTVFVGQPPSLTLLNHQGKTFYQAVISQLSSNQPFMINRVMMITTPPEGTAKTPGQYTVGTSVQTSGAFIKQFASQINSIKQNRPDLEVFVMPDVENSSKAWSDWQGWKEVNSPSCQAVASLPEGSPKRWVTKSICWANKVNELIPGTIDGIAYDGQGFILGNDPTTVAKIVHQSGNSIQTLGWVSGGYKAGADINFIEIYDLYKGGHGSVRIDTVTPDSAWKLNGKSNVFPGTQFSGEVNASIYNCAIDAKNNRCDNYSKYISPTLSPSEQMIQSWNYIYNMKGSGSFLLDTGIPKMSNDNTVFMFSTQYKGIMGSKGQSNTSASQCLRLQYIANTPSTASCGDENGFGTWYQASSSFDPLNEFKAATSGYLTGVCTGTSGAKCDYGTNNMGGIWMYDYIPQSWYGTTGKQ